MVATSAVLAASKRFRSGTAASAVSLGSEVATRAPSAATRNWTTGVITTLLSAEANFACSAAGDVS